MPSSAVRADRGTAPLLRFRRGGRITALVGAIALLPLSCSGTDRPAPPTTGPTTAAATSVPPPPGSGSADQFSGRKAYADAPWADALQDEQSEKVAFEASDAGLYDVVDVAGVYTNVTDHIRTTLEPPPCERCRPARLWIAGGSAVFGLGQRDDRTIASDLVRIAGAHGIRLEVTNLGTPSWTIWQEVRKVEHRLDGGATPPDLVVFHDGYNDVVGTVIASTLHGIDPDAPTIVTPPDMQAFTERRPSPADVATPERLGSLAATKYRREMDDVRTSLSARGIPAVFTFQPDALAPSPQPAPERWLTDTEATDVLADPALQAYFGRAFATAQEDLAPDVVNLRNVFEDNAWPVFADLVHTNELGASIVAEALFRLLEPQLDRMAR